MEENSIFDKKSLSIIIGNTANWDELAKDCVCFANAVGGEIHIGIEDSEDQPSPNQKIDLELIEKISKIIPALTINVVIFPRIKAAENGGQYIILQIFRSSQAIASTSKGKYYIRIADECKPILPADMARLASDKNAFIWEEKTTKEILYTQSDNSKLNEFINDIKNSERVSNFVKGMSIEEILEYYLLTKENHLTNLGILWIGTQGQRAGLHYAPTIQFIKYNDLDRKTKKMVWDDFTKNPKELINEIINDIPDWNEYTEISDGIFRKNIYNYESDVIRELIVNAIVHRNYSMGGDIFINLYTDRVEIHSPGLLPLGVTPKNILTKSIQRNQLLSKIFYDVRLMEKEGSGYDNVYEVLLTNAKRLPDVIEGDDRVVVTVYKNIINNDVLRIMQRASKEYKLKQKEIISLGIIAQKGDVYAWELSELLNIKGANTLQNWLGQLLKLELVLSKGKTKDRLYYINPNFLRSANFITKTTLKKIEPYRLKELILTDLKDYPDSSITEINQRIGPEINKRTLKSRLDIMINEMLIIKQGEKRWTKYSININTLNK